MNKLKWHDLLEIGATSHRTSMSKNEHENPTEFLNRAFDGSNKLF